MITDGDLLNPTTKNKQFNDITDGDLLNPTTKNKQFNDHRWRSTESNH